MRTRTSIAILLATAAVVLSVSVPAAIGADPALRCQSAKLAVVRAEAAARLACEQRGLAGEPTAACILKAAQRRDTSFAQLDGTGACSTVGDTAVLGDAVEGVVSSLRNALLPGGPAPSACTASQLAAVRSALARLVRAHLRDARTPDWVRLAGAVADARTELGKRFVRAAQRGDCLSASTFDDIFNLLAPAAITLRGMLLATCPCWTAAQIDAAFPPGFFDANGRGGVVCDSAAPSISAADTCDLFGPVGQVFTFPRGGAAVLDGRICLVVGDYDLNNTGTCSGVPTITSIGPEQVAACTARLLVSSAYHHLCPP